MNFFRSKVKIEPNSFAYLCVLDQEKSPGVYNKVLGTIKGAEKNGYKSRVWCTTPDAGFIKRMADMIIHSPEKFIMIRSLCQYNIFILHALVIARHQGKKIVLDVPTPNRVAIREILNGERGSFGKFKWLMYLLVPGPVSFWFVHRVVQYAKEGEWFLIGNKNKTKIIGNGIDFESFSPRNNFPSWPDPQLRLIVVASLNYWHGVDRLIQAMHVYNREARSGFRVYLTVVGGGQALEKLKDLVVELELQKEVHFTGYLSGSALDAYYEKSHVGVGSLGLFRIKLQEASILKAREYTAMGLPFIAAGQDPDFPEETPFRYKVANSEETASIIEFFRDFEKFYTRINFDEIRLFAREKLDYAAKFKQITLGI
jgi:glycosyltransferase involved in cell wall biosynthesis